MAQVLVDTSAIYALIDKDDSYHIRAVAILRSLPRHGLSSFITNFIIAESHALLLSRLGAPTARAWLLNQNWPIEPVSLADEEKAKQIIRRYTDKTFSYTDAASFALFDGEARRERSLRLRPALSAVRL